MAKKKGPSPKANFSPLRQQNAPRLPTGSQFNYNNELVKWRTSEVDMEGPFGWHEICRKELLTEVIEKLHDLGTQKFCDCIGPSKGSHSIPIEQLSKTAQDRLIELGIDQYDELVSLRLTSKQRVWAIRDFAILRLLWWDPDHQVYPVSKKHT